MELSDGELEKIREEELIRLQLREEMKRKREPRLIVISTIWVIALTMLAYLTPRFAYWLK